MNPQYGAFYSKPAGWYVSAYGPDAIKVQVLTKKRARRYAFLLNTWGPVQAERIYEKERMSGYLKQIEAMEKKSE